MESAPPRQFPEEKGDGSIFSQSVSSDTLTQHKNRAVPFFFPYLFPPDSAVKKIALFLRFFP
jgi:hypothetical protein